jgi:hypothetical protein
VTFDEMEFDREFGNSSELAYSRAGSPSHP